MEVLTLNLYSNNHRIAIEIIQTQLAFPELVLLSLLGLFTNLVNLVYLHNINERNKQGADGQE
jgi:hypothetical protein